MLTKIVVAILVASFIAGFLDTDYGGYDFCDRVLNGLMSAFVVCLCGVLLALLISAIAFLFA